MINPTSGKRLLTPPFSLSFLYTIQESGPSGRTVRFPVFIGESGGPRERVDTRVCPCKAFCRSKGGPWRNGLTRELGPAKGLCSFCFVDYQLIFIEKQ